MNSQPNDFLADLDAPLPVDPDISELMKSADLHWLPPAGTYQMANVNGHLWRINDLAICAMKAAIPIAEMYYAQLQKIIPKESIIQHRIGIDNETAGLTTMTIVSTEQVNELDKINTLSRRLELGLSRLHGLDYNFWVMTDGDFDQEGVDSDYPYYRTGLG